MKKMILMLMAMVVFGNVLGFTGPFPKWTEGDRTIKYIQTSYPSENKTDLNIFVITDDGYTFVYSATESIGYSIEKARAKINPSLRDRG